MTFEEIFNDKTRVAQCVKPGAAALQLVMSLLFTEERGGLLSGVCRQVNTHEHKPDDEADSQSSSSDQNCPGNTQTQRLGPGVMAQQRPLIPLLCVCVCVCVSQVSW